MRAAVLHNFGEAPRYEDFPDPEEEPGEQLIKVKAASLNNISRMRATGSHYDSYQQLPVVCGVDGIGMREDGVRIYT